MLLGKLVLWISALMFIAYGLVGLVAPAVPAGFAGLDMTNGDAYAEIGAMYGGLQTGIGVFCLVAVRKPALFQAGLLLLVIGIGLLAVARLVAALTASDALTAYTYGALAYEFATAIFAAIAYRQTTGKPAH